MAFSRCFRRGVRLSLFKSEQLEGAMPLNEVKLSQVAPDIFELTLDSGEVVWTRLCSSPLWQKALDQNIYQFINKKNPELAVGRRDLGNLSLSQLFVQHTTFYSPVNGHSINYRYISDCLKTANFIGRFHQLMNANMPEVLPRNTLGRLIMIWERRLYRIKEYIRIATYRAEPGEFDSLFLDNRIELLSDIECALRRLKQGPYNDLCSEGGRVCFYHYQSDRFWSMKERVAAWHFFKCHWDLPVVDLYRYIIRLAKYNGYRDSVIRPVLDTYQSWRQLSDKEQYVFKNLFLFPDRLYRIIASHYMSRSQRTYREQVQSLKTELYYNDERMELKFFR